jgi:formylglycine-generating enzyme required for sulfatase activity
MRAGLALLPTQPGLVRSDLEKWMLETDDPAEFLLVRNRLAALATPTPAQLAELWRQAKQTRGTTRLRALAALAGFVNADNPDWSKQEVDAAEPLLSENPLNLTTWTEALRPVRQWLVPSLRRYYGPMRGRRAEDAVLIGADAAARARWRVPAATVLADYTSDDPKKLVDLMLDSDETTYRLFKQLVLQHGDQAIPQLREELKRWPDPEQNRAGGRRPDEKGAAPATVEADLVADLVKENGMVTERFAFCPTLPQGRVKEVSDALLKGGYRPVRYRPYSLGKETRVALVWLRDGRPSKFDTDLPRDDVKKLEETRQKEGFVPVDVAGYVTRDGLVRYGVLWVEAGPAHADKQEGAEPAADGEERAPLDKETARLFVGLKEADYAALAEKWGKDDLAPRTLNELVSPDGRLLSGVWGDVAAKVKEKAVAETDLDAMALTGSHLDRLLVDVSLRSQPEWERITRPWLLVPRGLAGWPWYVLSGAAAQDSSPNRRYAAVWRADSDSEINFNPPNGQAARPATNPGPCQAICLSGLPLEEHRQRCRELADRGYRPTALSVAEVGGGQVLAASVWHRPVVPAWEKNALAIRQANAVVTLQHLGQQPGPDEQEPLAGLLREREAAKAPRQPGEDDLAPETRTALRVQLLARLGPLGIDVKKVLGWLDQESNPSGRRALILALGEYGADQLPLADREPLVHKLLEWYRTDPDAGVHGAIDWLLRQGKEGLAPRPLNWKQADALERIDRELARDGQPLDPALKRPLRTRGSRPPNLIVPKAPGWWVSRSGQTFTVIPGPLEFLMGSPSSEQDRTDNETLHRRRIPRSFAVATKTVTVRQFREFLRAYPKIESYKYDEDKFSPDPDCPIIYVNWLEAAEFCRWLSEKEGIPEEEMCFPPIEEIEKAKLDGTPLKLPANYLSRKGYRLPTEAEYEYACRAGTSTSRFCGSDEVLLGRYAWHDGNSGDWPWPVGQKRPNDFGCFDMLGNVWQWCQDDPPPSFYLEGWRGRVSQPYEEHRDVADSFRFVYRGGGFDSKFSSVRCAARSFDVPSTRFVSGGFRVARSW